MQYTYFVDNAICIDLLNYDMLTTINSRKLHCFEVCTMSTVTARHDLYDAS